MRYKGTLILLVLVFLMGLYLLLIELPGQKARVEEEERAKTVVQFKPQEAVALLLTYPGRSSDQEILLEKDPEEEWRIVKPISTEADQTEVSGLLSSLQTMQIERVVEGMTQDEIKNRKEGQK